MLTRLLVTGATGYVGSRLCAELASREGVSVRALVRNVADWLDVDDQVAVEDLSCAERLDRAVDGIDAVVHLAGSNEVVASESPDRAFADTAIGTRRLIDAAAGVARFVYLSTIHVYGRALEPASLVDEEVVPQPQGVYAIARLAAEHIARARAVDTTEVVVLRLTNSVGAPLHPAVNRWTLVANDLCRQVAVRGSLELRSDGMQWRDFVSLGEVCSLLSDVALGALAPGTYNVGSGESMTVRSLAELVQNVTERQTGRRPPLTVGPASGSPSSPYVVSVDRLAAAGYRLSHDVANAIDETLRFCLKWKDRLDR